jgi:hypothetical protein
MNALIGMFFFFGRPDVQDDNMRVLYINYH